MKNLVFLIFLVGLCVGSISCSLDNANDNQDHIEQDQLVDLKKPPRSIQRIENLGYLNANLFEILSRMIKPAFVSNSEFKMIESKLQNNNCFSF